MNRILVSFTGSLLILVLISFGSYKAYGEETESILLQLKVLQKDIKTLEKAVYAQENKNLSGNVELSGNSGDVLTKHLLKLSDLEEQFKILTNSFEEINFKLDNYPTELQKFKQIIRCVFKI